MKIFKSIGRQKIFAIIGILILLVSALFSGNIIASAEVIYEEENPEFKYYQDYDGKQTIMVAPNGENPTGKLTQYDGKEYSFETDAFCTWQTEDNASYAYNKYNLNHGKESIMTISMTITSHSTIDATKNMHEGAAIGICIRNTQEKDGNYDSDKSSANVYLHIRRDRAYLTFRKQDGGNTSKDDKATVGITKEDFPITLVMKKKGTAVNSTVIKADGTSFNMPVVYNTFTNVVTAGVITYSCEKLTPTVSKFKDYSVQIEGPEGAKYVPVGGTQEDSDDTLTEEEILENAMPKDPSLTEGILFKETFTDGSLVNKSEDGKEHIDNPIWKDDYSIDGTAADAIITKEGDNRYLQYVLSTQAYFFPNFEWTDYSFSVRMKFDKKELERSVNNVNLYVRFNAARATGYLGYRIALEDGNTVSIYKIALSKDQNATTNLLSSTTYEYISTEWKTWRVEAFDNTISLYCGNSEEPVISYTEEENAYIGQLPAHGRGGIGIGVDKASVMIDDIIVRKMEDLLGGDYDNKICGNWNEPIPEYIENFTYEIK